MRSLIFSIIFGVWAIGASYWYVCKIKDNCSKENNKPEISEIIDTDKADNTAQGEASPPKEEETSKNTDKANEDSIAYLQAKADSLADLEKTKQKELNELIEKLNSTVLYFDFASKTTPINDEVKQNFTKLAEYAKDTPLQITLTGHSDTKGSNEANNSFSLKRAEFVKNKLIDYGIPGDNVSVEGKGTTEPIASNDTDEGRAKNRRVNINIKK